ncbi:MAG TPA: hypothetical protein VK674_04585 [Candidatus Limnocylindria bacterium]|nr:hypothetical protein [Candidatus Limnocylindria bacterium]
MKFRDCRAGSPVLFVPPERFYQRPIGRWRRLLTLAGQKSTGEPVRRLSLLLATVLFAVLQPAPVAAQTASGGRLDLTSSPLPISLKAKPGKTVETELRVRNSGTKTEKLKVGLMKFSAFGEEGKPRLEERAPGDDYFNWVKFSKTQLEARPNEWQSVKMTITLPETAAFGYYYAVTFTRADAEAAEGNLESAVRGGSATLVLLEADVPGAKRDVSLQEFTASKRTYEFLPARFTIKLHNNGTVHTAPTGTIFINKGSQQVAALGVNQTKGNILPDSSRVYAAAWDEGFPAYRAKEADGQVVLKDGEPEYELKWDTNKLKNLRFGKYSATLVMVYDDGTRDVPLEATVSFWVIPWRLIGGGLLVAVFVGIGIWSTGRKVIARIKKLRS